MGNSHIVIHTDGGSRGNPGPGACAFVVEKEGSVVYSDSKYLGKVTNNFAEYSGVVLALEWLRQSNLIQDIDQVVFILDSELVVRQLNGIYKVKDAVLQKLNLKVKELITLTNKEVFFKNVLRSENKLADKLLNEELDRQN